MSRRCVGYEGEGKTRRPLYVDEGPASASASSVMAMHETGGMPHLAVPKAGAGDVEISRVEVDEETRREAREARTAIGQPFERRPRSSATSDAERMQASRQRGAARHVEVITGRKPVTPALEEAPVAEAAQDVTTDPPSEPIADILAVLADAVVTAIETWSEKLQADHLADQATIRWAEARRALEAAYRALDETPSVDEILEASAGLARLAADEARASVALDGETQVVDEPMLERAREHSLVDRLTKSDPLAFVEAQEDADPPAIGEGPAPRRNVREPRTTGLTARQTKAIELMQGGKTRADIARAMGTTYQTVDGLLEAAAKKGLLPAELIPLMPARFAKYSGVPA